MCCRRPIKLSLVGIRDILINNRSIQLNMLTVGIAILACLLYLFVCMLAIPFGHAASPNYTYRANLTPVKTDVNRNKNESQFKSGMNPMTSTNFVYGINFRNATARIRNNVKSKRPVSLTPSLNMARISTKFSDLNVKQLKTMLRKALKSDVNYDTTTSQFMLQLYNKLRHGQNLSAASGHITGPLDAIKPDTIRSFSPRGISIAYTRTVSFDYKVPRLPLDEQIRMAEFRIKRTSNKHNMGSRVKIFIKRGRVRIKKIVVKVKPLASSDMTYDIYDITSAVRPWINGLHGNVTLRIVVRSRIKLPKMADRTELVQSLLGDGKDYGLLVFYSEDKEFMHKIYTSFTERNTRRRSKRSAKNVDVDSVNSKYYVRRKRESRRHARRRKNRRLRKPCMKVDLAVNFEEIGWGRWIVYPETYNAFACKGSCKAPIGSNLSPTNHAMLQSLMRQSRGKAVHMPCCAPVELSPLSMLYYEYGEIVVRHHEDMVVKKCACR